MEALQSLLIPSLEELMARFKGSHEEYRLNTIYSKKIFKWSKGRSYCIQGDFIFIIYTNLPNVNHLNLEEYSLHHSGLKSSNKIIFLEKALKHDPLLLNFSLYNANKHTAHIFQHVLKAMREQSDIVKHVMEEEYKYTTMISLLQRWDAEKFQRLVDHRLLIHSRDFLAHPTCQPYLVLLMMSCKVSHFVVDFFRKICTRFHDHNKRFFTLLPSEYIYFFARHLGESGYLSAMQDHHAHPCTQWLVYEDLLAIGFKRQDVKLVRLALDMNCPSDWLPSAVSVDNPPFPADKCWPRKKNDVNPKSFNSSEYYINFTTELLLIARTCGKKELADCFHLVWRAIPVPYLPLEDMQRCTGRLLTLVTKREVTEHEEIEPLWRFFETLFEEDFPHEYKPRSLKHLSRYAIRRRCSLPERIADLPLPGLLKRYVKLEF